MAAMVGLALVPLGACSSGGQHEAARTSRPAVVASTPDDLASAASTDLVGRATVTVPGRPATVVTLTSSPDDPSTVDQSAEGATTLSLPFSDAASDMLSIDGTAHAGRADVHVSLFIDSLGVFVDTSQGGECHTTFATVTETAVRGTTSCLAAVEQRQVTVTAQFSAS